MNRYEVLYIIASDAAENVREDLIARFEALVIKNGGTVESVDKWGMRKFAYPIHYKNEGFYVLMNFTAGPDFVAELERQMRITDEIVRQMVVRKDAEPEKE